MEKIYLFPSFEKYTCLQVTPIYQFIQLLKQNLRKKQSDLMLLPETVEHQAKTVWRSV